MGDVFTSLAEQALGQAMAIQPVVAPRFGSAPSLSAGMLITTFDGNTPTTPPAFSAPSPDQSTEWAEPLIPLDEARVAAPLPTFLQMAQLTPTIQTMIELAPGAVEDQTGTPSQAERSVSSPPDNEMNPSHQIIQRQQMPVTPAPAMLPASPDLPHAATATHPQSLQRLDATTPVTVQLQTIMPLAGASAVDKAALSATADPAVGATSTPIGPAAPNMPYRRDTEPAESLLSVDAQRQAKPLAEATNHTAVNLPAYKVAPEVPIATTSSTAASTHLPRYIPIVSDARIESGDTRKSVETPTFPSPTSETMSRVVERQVSSTDNAEVDQSASLLQTTHSATPQSNSVVQRRQNQPIEQIVAPMTASEPIGLVSPQIGPQNHVEPPAVAESFLVNTTKTQTAIAPIDEMPRSIVASTARATTQFDNDPQPLLRSTLPPSDSITSQQQNQRLASAVAPMTVSEPDKLVSPQIGPQNHVEPPAVGESFRVNATKTQTAIAPIDAAPRSVVASAARSTTQADNDPQPLLRSTLPPSDSIKPQQQNQRLASAVAPITAYESANFMSQHTGRQNVVETPVTPASIATGEVETQVTLSPVNETSQPASRSTARAPRQPRGTTAPDTAKHQPPELNPKQVITPAPMHTPSLEAAGLQYQAETDRQTVMARVNAAPRPTPPSATRLLEQHNDRLSLGSDDVAPPVVSASTANPARPLPLITGPNLSDKIDETFAPYRSDQNSLQPVVVEESIKPRPDLNLLATSAALPETAARHQQAETLTEPPTIRVTIGRIEVRTTTTPPSAAPRPRPAQPTISLQDYLKQNRSRKS